MAREALPLRLPEVRGRDPLSLNVWVRRKPVRSERLSPTSVADTHRRPQLQSYATPALRSHRGVLGLRGMLPLNPSHHASAPNLAMGGRIVGMSLSSPELSSLPRICTKSQVGSIGGIEKPANQDSSFVHESGGWHLAGVCDGHGLHGHLVSGYLRSTFPRLVFESLSFPDIARLQEQEAVALRNAYTRCAAGLRDANIDCSNSGSTCVCVLWFGSTLACGNVGDSRAVVGRRSAGGWSVEALSVDHKPELGAERLRIEKQGGEVSVSKISKVGPYRVYLKYQTYPGLAMSRSMGDEIAKSVGVTDEPDIIFRSLTKEDKFVIVASDGVWEFISSLEAVKIVALHWEQGEVAKACNALVKAAQYRWTASDNMTDDITVTVAFVNT